MISRTKSLIASGQVEEDRESVSAKEGVQGGYPRAHPAHRPTKLHLFLSQLHCMPVWSSWVDLFINTVPILAE